MPSSRLILRSYSWCGASALAFSPEKMLWNSWYYWGTPLRASSSCVVNVALALSWSGLIWGRLGICWMLLRASRNIVLPTSQQILSMALLLTSQMSIALGIRLVAFDSALHDSGLQNVIFVSTQSMLGLCWVSQL